ncbi:universal stress protein [Haladaptatus sp. DYF46]|uniref:universal stress protein n=1 Tax=Haladaptatus sp. DYF46 TaxID=2886041 RepID=UPI001E3BABAD|nr:universal stress protein [Haladaptatus sp. DYF46]
MEREDANQQSSDVSETTGTVTPTTTGAILIPVLDSHETNQSLEIGRALARVNNTGILLVRPVPLPPQRPLELSREEAEEQHKIVDELITQFSRDHPGVNIRGIVRLGRSSEQIIRSAVTEHGIGTVVIEYTPPSGRLKAVRRSPVERIADRLSCDVILTNGRGDFTSISSILIPVSSGNHSGLAVDVGHALAREYDAWTDILHIIPPDSPPTRHTRGEQYVSAAIDRTDRAERTNTWILEAGDVVETIVEQANYYDATVLGMSQKGRFRRLTFGSTTDGVYTTVRYPIMMAKQGGRWPSD